MRVAVPFGKLRIGRLPGPFHAEARLVEHADLVAPHVAVARQFVVHHDAVGRARPLRDALTRTPPEAEHVDRCVDRISRVVHQQRRPAVHAVVVARLRGVDIGRKAVIFVNVGIAALLEQEFGVFERDEGVDVVVGQFRNPTLLDGNRLSGNAFDHVFADQAADRVAFGILLAREDRAAEREREARAARQHVVLRRVEAQAEAVAAVGAFEVGRAVVDRHVDLVVRNAGVGLHVLAVEVADDDAFDQNILVDGRAFGRRQRPHVGERHLAAELVVLVGLRDVEVGREGLLPAVDVAQVDDRLADVVARVGFRVDDQHALLGLHAANPVSGRTDVGSRDGEVPERDVGVDLELGEGLDAAADRLVGSRTFERRNHAVLLDADRVGPCAAVEHEAQFGHAAERIVLRKGDRNHPVAVEFRPVDRSPASDVVERLDPDPAVGIKLYFGGSARRRDEKFVLGGREFAHADGFGVIDRAADGRQGRQAAHRAVA